eukprot:scaffold39635_cov46-Prasinocladus_malaysianus.AAC.1
MLALPAQRPQAGQLTQSRAPCSHRGAEHRPLALPCQAGLVEVLARVLEDPAGVGASPVGQDPGHAAELRYLVHLAGCEGGDDADGAQGTVGDADPAGLFVALAVVLCGVAKGSLGGIAAAYRAALGLELASRRAGCLAAGRTVDAVDAVLVEECVNTRELRGVVAVGVVVG